MKLLLKRVGGEDNREDEEEDEEEDEAAAAAGLFWGGCGLVMSLRKDKPPCEELEA